jgi:nucleoside-diphosphate-sugar epimerase
VTLRKLLITGASGFVGRHLLEAIKDDFVVYGLARRSQQRSGAPVHPNIRWFQVDIGDRAEVDRAFRLIREAGGVDAVIHLAAHYDFTGDDHPDYWRTNVEGLRHVLDASRATGVRRFVFSSSVAACRFPAVGKAVTEDSPPDGVEIYSRSKAVGEAMIAEYRDTMKPVIVRFGALFSDWCEYPPLFVLINTWLSGAWNRRVLPGQGRTAFPYLHVREVAPFMRRLLDRFEELVPGEVLIMSTDAATSYRQIHEAITSEHAGQALRPLFVPKALCRPGIRLRDFLGRVTGDRPFERAWMADYIDGVLAVDASKTRHRLGWKPRERLELLRRTPFLLENLKMDPIEWNRRNRQAMRRLRVSANLRIYTLLEKHSDEIARRITAYLTGEEGRSRFPNYHELPRDLHDWHHALVLRHLMNAVRTRDRGVFFSYCDDLAARRFQQGFPAREICDALETVGRIALDVVSADPESAGLGSSLDDFVTMAIRVGADRVLDTFDTLEASGKRPGKFAKRGL